MMHKFAREVLIHYECAWCSRWWSISDASVTAPVLCPHCGHHDYAAELADDDQEYKEPNNDG